MMRVGIGIGNVGPEALGIRDRARLAEEAGFDTIWMSDHIVNPVAISSRYPYREDGGVPWSPETPWFDVVVAMSQAAAVTSRVEIASGVLVLPLREPVALASQIASLDALSGGRVTLGVGAGWLAEEFAALRVDFSRRGPLTDEYIALLRALWAGPVGPYRGTSVSLPETVRCEPMPDHVIPILIGGSSPAALLRAGAVGDGWYGLFASPPPLERLQAHIAQMRAAAETVGRDWASLRVVTTIGREPGELGQTLLAYANLGVTDVVARADLSDLDGARALVEQVHSTAV